MERKGERKREKKREIERGRGRKGKKERNCFVLPACY